MGLLDNLTGDSLDDPRTTALMAGIQGLLGGRGTLRGISGGLLARNEAMSQIQQQQQAQQMQRVALQTHQLQLTQMQQQIARQNAIRDDLAKAETGGALTQPSTGAAPASMAFKPGFNAQGPIPVQQSAAPAQAASAGGNLTDGLTQRLVQQAGIYAKNGDFESANKLYEQAAKFMPEVKELSVSMRDGQPVNVITYKNGKQEVSGFSPTPKLHFADTGGAVVPINEYTGQVVAGGAKKTVSPDTAYSAAVTKRGQDMTDSRARDLNAITREGQQTQVINDPERGVLFANKGTGLIRPGVGLDGKPLVGESAIKRENAANRTLPLLDEADKLIDQATGSYIGAGVDMAGRAMGMTTAGAKATAQLRVLEGNLMLSQPRMEGPQSDKDTMLYRQMAGQIGDPTVPGEIKKAALQTIRQIQEKYAGKKPAAQPIQGLKFLGFEGQ